MLRRALPIPVVLVTHDMDEALALADRMCLLDRGRGLRDGPPADLLARPATAEVARLLDLRDLFRGVVERHDAAIGTTWLRWGRYMLEAAHAPAFAAGESEDWLVPGWAAVLHGRESLSAGEHENPVSARVVELLALGNEARATLDVGDPDGGTLALALHLARRDGLVPGTECIVSLLREGLHVMPVGQPWPGMPRVLPDPPPDGQSMERGAVNAGRRGPPSRSRLGFQPVADARLGAQQPRGPRASDANGRRRRGDVDAEILRVRRVGGVPDRGEEGRGPAGGDVRRLTGFLRPTVIT